MAHKRDGKAGGGQSAGMPGDEVLPTFRQLALPKKLFSALLPRPTTRRKCSKSTIAAPVCIRGHHS